MVQRAVAREAVHALRREIARIEGRLPERLAAGPSTDGKSGDEVFVRRSGLAEGGLLATGARRLDEALGGGLSYAALTEIHGRETRDAGAVAGFALGLVSLALRRKPGPLLWVAAGDMFDEAGKPYAPGMSRFGIRPKRCSQQRLAGWRMRSGSPRRPPRRLRSERWCSRCVERRSST